MTLHHGGRGPGHLSRWPKAAGEVTPPPTRPTLTGPTGTAMGATTASLSVSTNEAGGTLYWYVSTSATPPSAANLKAGTGAVDAGNQAVTATGAQTASADGLTAETSYYAHFLHRDAAGNDSAIVTSAAFVTGAQYGRTPGYNAGTAGDWFVAPDGSDAAAGTSVAAPFATLGKALSVASAGQTIRLRGGADEVSIVKYRENNTITTKNNLRIASYGSEYAELSGALRVTGFTACTSGDEAAVGPNYASVYKATVATSAIEHTSYHALILTEADVPLDLVQMRRDMSNLFALDDYTTMYTDTPSDGGAADDVTIGVDGSGYFQTITHDAVLGSYTDAQLARCSVAVHAYPNLISILGVASASSGVLTLEANTDTPDTVPNGERYALLNILPEIAAGQWAYVDNGDGTLTLYVWPNNAATINASIDVAARKSVLTVNTSTGLEIDGLYIGQCSGDLPNDSTALRLYKSSGIVHDLHCRNYSAAQTGYGSIYVQSCTEMVVQNVTFRHGQNNFGATWGALSEDVTDGNRAIALDARYLSKSAIRVYTQSLFAAVDILQRDCCYSAHANQFAFYISCDRWVVLGYNGETRLNAYATNQKSSRGLILNSNIPVGQNGTGFYDQSGGGSGTPPVNPSNNYFINNFVWPDPDRIAAQSVRLGDTTDGTNWYAYNNVVPDIYEIESGTLDARKNNVLFVGGTGDASETLVSNALDAFYDPDALNWKTLPGSILTSKSGFDVTSVIEMYEGWFPDVDFRRDMTGAVWNPAAPGVGPYGTAWPVESDTTAPTLSAFDDGTPTDAGSILSVTTDEKGGTLYWVRLADGAATPSAAQVVAGQDSTGTPAGESDNQTVTAAGTQSFAMTGTTATTYKIAAVHKDRHANLSNVLTGSVTLAAAFSPMWVAFNGSNYLKRSTGISGAQATTQSFLIAVTHKRSSVQNVSSSGGVMYTFPAVRAMIVDYITNHKLRAKFESSDESNTLIFDQNIVSQTGADGDDIEFLTLYRGYNDGSNFVMQERVIKIASGTVISTADKTTATSNYVTWASTTMFNIFNCAASFERFMLWDSATADITASAGQDLFYDSVAKALKNPAVAVASLGTPLISFYGSRLTSGSNAGSGGDWTFS